MSSKLLVTKPFPVRTQTLSRASVPDTCSDSWAAGALRRPCGRALTWHTEVHSGNCCGTMIILELDQDRAAVLMYTAGDAERTLVFAELHGRVLLLGHLHTILVPGPFG